jgi:ribosomal protein S18 acetylase RimI-like enzyme
LLVVDLGVAPDRRRRGVGRTLMAALEAVPELPPNAEIKMFLSASCTAAVSLLRSMEYSVTDFYMRKPL